jgi:coenzyme Q-binding protein COQ10
MHSFRETKVIPYDIELIYKIIMDIETYPEFLPWCSSATIISKQDGMLFADLTVSFHGISESYRSQVSSRKIHDGYEIKAVSNNGPFKKLENIWRIKSLNNGTKVAFSIDFEFKSRILNMVIGMFFSAAVEKMIVAFDARAKELSVDHSVIL